MKHRMLYLIVAIPAAAVIMGILTLVVAFSNPDPGVLRDAPEMTKTSWRSGS